MSNRRGGQEESKQVPETIFFYAAFTHEKGGQLLPLYSTAQQSKVKYNTPVR